ncbi:MAG: hypothetical protein JO171_16065 [Paludibacterium sp.]|uniref:hypothetical protein n=1 Tax=Paludibacterium sp. TaxID=1917523 RepID=UPI0025D5A54B|nr:hypothetical protein [Paludibacterium sp.]MBV8048664.1 hypothetical protein [Paludibacterium sp.]MBV8645969.1 hypothetical protein [Paludibacterium sp.]
MGLLVTELRVLEHFIQLNQNKKNRKLRVLALGYPTFLALAEYFAELNIAVDWRDIKLESDSAALWKEHNWDEFIDKPMFETRSLFETMGCEFVVVDAITWGGEDFILNLNLPIDDAMLHALGKFDIILDPGTIEHCFNVSQALQNVDDLLEQDGFVFHQIAIAFPNHGFWNISPIALFAFYHQRRYALGQPYAWSSPRIPVFQRIHPAMRFDSYPSWLIGALCFRKTVESPRSSGFPSLQGILSEIDALPLEDWCLAALPEAYCVPPVSGSH